jgi:hypothetical protein
VVDPISVNRRSRTAPRDARYRVSATAWSDRVFEDIYDIPRVVDRIRGPGCLRRAALALAILGLVAIQQVNNLLRKMRLVRGQKSPRCSFLLVDDTIRRWHGALAEGGRKALMRFEAGGSAYALSEAQQGKPARSEALITS